MSNAPTPKKHKRKTSEPTHVIHTIVPTAHVHHRTQTPTASPTVHVRVRTEEDPPVPFPPLNFTLVMDEFNHTDPPVPMQTQLLYSSSESSPDSVLTNPGVYVGAMFMLPMIVLGAWVVQGRVRRRYYHPIPNDGDDFPELGVVRLSTHTDGAV
jgi:hypothetical protein